MFARIRVCSRDKRPGTVFHSMARLPQTIRFVTTDDGLRLAWADAGSGPPLVKAANWLSHLEYDWESPVWRHWTRFFAGTFRYIRYDERGCGMSDAVTGELSLDRWMEDLERVVDASGVSTPFTLLGISQGAPICVGYVVRHPERVARLILYGGYARGVSGGATRRRPASAKPS